MAAFAAGPPFTLALFLLASASLCLAATQVIAGTMVQQAIPDALRGRISALGSAGQNGLAGLAAAATSAVAAAVGPGLAVSVLAATTASAGILLALLIARATHTAQKNQPSERKPPDWIPDDRINGRGQ